MKNIIPIYAYVYPAIYESLYPFPSNLYLHIHLHIAFQVYIRIVSSTYRSIAI